ncbi:MAG: hypothetical protein WC545_03805 [Patescibacteria group bacterium]
MKRKLLFFISIFFTLVLAFSAEAATSPRGCETDTMKSGVFCNWAELKSWCDGNTLVCAVESTEDCPANPTGGTYTFSCNINDCILSCTTGYTKCSETCKLNVSVPSNCTSFNQCTEVCSACAQGYELISGSCVGATLKLSSSSVGASNYIFQSSTPSLSILASGDVGVGKIDQTYKLDVNGLGNFNDFVTGLTPMDTQTNAFATVDYVNTYAGGSGSEFWDGEVTGDIWNLNSGNVGIGTNSPYSTLHLNVGSAGALQISAGADSGAFLQSGGTAEFHLIGGAKYTSYSSPNFIYTAKSTAFGGIYSGGGNLYFSTGTGLTAGNTFNQNDYRRMIINSSGNVGIGTMAPGALLTVSRSATPIISLEESGQAANNKIWQVRQNGGLFQIVAGNDAYSGSHKGIEITRSATVGYVGNINFYTSTSQPRMTILETGNVGIATTDPGTHLEVSQGTYSLPATIGSVQTGSLRLSARTSGNVVLDMGVSNPPVASWIQSTNRGSLDAAYPLFLNPNGGNVGIGTTTPGSNRLSVNGVGNFDGFVYGDTPNDTDDYALTTVEYVNELFTGVPGGTPDAGGYLPLIGGMMKGDITMEEWTSDDPPEFVEKHNITGINELEAEKITAATIDPLYTLNKTNYATFVASIVGGVKEEYTGKIKIRKAVMAPTGREYEAIIDFASAEEGSEPWVWYQVVDFAPDNVEAFITPYGKFANTYYFIDGERLVFRADRPVEVSYRLIGKRFDWRDWPLKPFDQSGKGLEVKLIK